MLDSTVHRFIYQNVFNNSQIISKVKAPIFSQVLSIVHVLARRSVTQKFHNVHNFSGCERLGWIVGAASCRREETSHWSVHAITTLLKATNTPRFSALKAAMEAWKLSRDKDMAHRPVKLQWFAFLNCQLTTYQVKYLVPSNTPSCFPTANKSSV